MIKRREFIKKASVAAIGSSALINACTNENKNESAAIISDKKYEWKMVTSWPPHFPILGEGAERIAKTIEQMSGGRIKIQVYGGGELVPPFESFDAVGSGVAEMCHSASYYWAGKLPSAQFFTSVPFGMNTQQTNAWLYYGEGLNLWKKCYDSFNLIPFPAGNTGGQMGGWYNREIKSIADYKGLKMRQPGIGGKVITKAGAASILSPGGELYTNLERGVIDATDWVGPYHDYLMGFHKIAKYYYYPGWQEPTGVIELIVNKSAYNSLPNDLQEIIKFAAMSAQTDIISEFENKNQEYLEKMKEEKVNILKLPEDVLINFKKFSKESIEEITEVDALSNEVYKSYTKFQKRISPWSSLSEYNYSGS